MTSLIHRTYSLWLLLLGPLVFVFAIGPWIDRTKFPVVDPFVVVNTQHHAGYIEANGWLEKRRDCKLLEIYAVVYMEDGPPRVSDITFKDRSKPDLISRPVMTQFWGPWEVFAPVGAKRIAVRTKHRCHPLWDTSSEKLLWERDQ